MAEYIDRKKVEKKVLGPTIVDPAVAAYAEAVLFILRHEPAADVAPVVHGKWEFPIFCYNDADDPRCVCSECGSIETPLARHSYCPNCGAKMDGGD